jgi:hypothetical protein
MIPSSEDGTYSNSKLIFPKILLDFYSQIFEVLTSKSSIVAVSLTGNSFSTNSNSVDNLCLPSIILNLEMPSGVIS